MVRMLVFQLLVVAAVSASQRESSAAEGGVREANSTCSLPEQYLYSGEFAAGETAILLALDKEPDNDSLRFGLGVVQLARAVDILGQALYEYGALSEHANQPFLRLPVPRNDAPSKLSYRELGRVLDCFSMQLAQAETTLAKIKRDDVKLPLMLNRIAFNFGGAANKKTLLVDTFDNRRRVLRAADPNLRIHFDRGDVAWLRAYCHLLMAMVDGYRAVDEEVGFAQRVGDVFPDLEVGSQEESIPDWESGARIVDPPRLRRMRMHMLAVCELNRETWEHIRSEEDDDFEWLPNVKQTDQLGLSLSKQQIDSWLAMMQQLEGICRGEVLVPGYLLKFLSPDHPDGLGLNFKSLFDDPPTDLLNARRIREEGIDLKYLEEEADREVLNLASLIGAFQFFNGPWGFARAARMN